MDLDFTWIRNEDSKFNINCAEEQTLPHSLIPLFFGTPCRSCIPRLCSYFRLLRASQDADKSSCQSCVKCLRCAIGLGGRGFYSSWVDLRSRFWWGRGIRPNVMQYQKGQVHSFLLYSAIDRCLFLETHGFIDTPMGYSCYVGLVVLS